MRPVDFIGRIVKTESKQLVSQVEGTIFPYEDKVRGTSGWQGNLLKWKDQQALLDAQQAGERLLLLCNDGRQGEIVLTPDVADWGTGMTFRGVGALSEPTRPPSWRLLDRSRADDGAPDPT